METYPGPTGHALDDISAVLFLLRLVAACLSLLLAVILGLLLFVRRRKNRTFYNGLYGNLTLATALFCVTLRPGTILRSVPSFQLSAAYCTLFVLLLEVETITVPLLILMLAIERVIYLGDRCCSWKDETYLYTPRIAGLRRAIMLALPWILGFITAIIKTFGLLKPIEALPARPSDNSTIAAMLGREEEREEAAMVNEKCYLEGRSEGAHVVGEVILFTLRSSFPAIYLAISVGLLMSWWRIYFYLYHPAKPSIYKGPLKTSAQERSEGESLRLPTALRRTEDPEVDESYELPTKPTGSLVVTCLLSFMMICVAITSTYYTKTGGWLDGSTQWLFFITETTAVILPYMSFPEIRNALFCCCRFCRKYLQKEEF